MQPGTLFLGQLRLVLHALLRTSRSAAEGRNPHHRLTTPEDVAVCLVQLAHADTHWMNGNVLHVDGGEDVSG